MKVPMIIKNKEQLATTRIRKAALEIVEAGIERVLPSTVLEKGIHFDADRKMLQIDDDIFSISNGRIFVIGGGKASGLMAKSLEIIVGLDQITDGIVLCKETQIRPKHIKTLNAGHPIPDQRGISGVQSMLQLKNQYSICRDDFVICLISGGGSALMPFPANGITLSDKRILTEQLLLSGASINEINAVRKHISNIKGGRLGQFFSPATIISLIISDVVGNDLSVIASGPTFPDSSTFADALKILQQYGLFEKAPPAVIELLKKGCQGSIPETPKTLDNCYNYIIGDNLLALEAMAEKAKDLGFNPRILTSQQKGDTQTVAEYIAKEVLKPINQEFDVFLLGGETTIKLPEIAGKGGRNQHYAAVSLDAMKVCPDEWALCSIGSDGSDYLSEVAGAIVDRHTITCLDNENIEVQPFLDSCDSNTLLNKVGNSIVVTGNTDTNVGDLIVYILDRKNKSED